MRSLEVTTLDSPDLERPFEYEFWLSNDGGTCMVSAIDHVRIQKYQELGRRDDEAFYVKVLEHEALEVFVEDFGEFQGGAE